MNSDRVKPRKEIGRDARGSALPPFSLFIWLITVRLSQLRACEKIQCKARVLVVARNKKLLTIQNPN
jgi:hypothetical protein